MQAQGLLEEGGGFVEPLFREQARTQLIQRLDGGGLGGQDLPETVPRAAPQAQAFPAEAQVEPGFGGGRLEGEHGLERRGSFFPPGGLGEECAQVRVRRREVGLSGDDVAQGGLGLRVPAQTDQRARQVVAGLQGVALERD